MPQQRVGWRAYVASTISSLLTSLYGAWNGDTTGTSLDASIFGAWNVETEENLSSLETSLFSVYNGESNTNDSYGTNNGTAVGSLTYTSGKVGNAFSFNGTNAYVSLPNNSLNFTGDFSVSFWVNPTSGIYTWKTIISNYKAGGSFGYGYAIGINEYYDKLQIIIRNNNQITQQWFDYAFTANTWHHVVISRKASNYTKCYINGTLVSGYYPVGGQTDPTFNPAYISNQIANIGGGNNTAGFNGKLDSVNIWTKELTQTEATQLYNSGMGIEYPFVGKLLSSPKDAVGTNHGTLLNGALITTGKIGNAFTFDGVNDYVSFPTNSWNSIVGTDFSVSLWVKFSSTANQTLISNMSSPSINYWSGWEIRLVGGQPTIYMWNNSGTGVGAQGAVVSTNTWYHIVATRKKGSRTRIYINGVLAQTDTNTPDPSISGTYYPNIGHLQYSSSYHGLYMTNGSLIDSVNLWSKEISADEVTQLYNSGTGAQYPFTGTFSSAGNQLGVDNGILVNGCYLSDGKIGKAFTFDGVNDYVQLPKNSLSVSGDFSLSVWLYYINGGQHQMIAGNFDYTGGAAVNGWSLFNPVPQVGNTTVNNPIQFTIGNGTSSVTLQATVRENDFIWYVNNTWYHFVITRKAGQRTRIYRNGVLDTENTSTFDPTYLSNTTPSIGAGYYASYPSTSSPLVQYFMSNGSKVDGFSFWRKELTQSEITELYNSGNGKQITATPIVQSGLVLNLDASRSSSYTGTGTTWTDISGSGNNGTLTNGPIFGTANGGVISFDGVNDYVDLGTKSSLAPGTTDFTISFWINPNNWGSLSSTSHSPIFVTLVTNGLWIGKNAANFVLRTAYIADDVQYSVLPTVNQWTMVTVNRVGNIAKIYYNGSVVASATVTRNYVSGNSYLANDIPSNGNFSNIKLSTFYYYNRGLSELEITQNFNSTKGRFGL
jgi:hypothetical protein